MSTKIPYSYFLYHKPTGLKYYGIKHGKNCHPDQLWKTYFSSSSIVKQLIKEHGADSFLYKVRKTFLDSESALLWEHKVLRRLKAAQRSDWINRHNGGSKFRSPVFHSQKTKDKLSLKIKGQRRSEETKAKMREKAKIREDRRRVDGWQYPADAQIKARATLNARIARGEINPYGSAFRAKQSKSKKGTKRKYLPDGSFIMVKPQDDQ